MVKELELAPVLQGSCVAVNLPAALTPEPSAFDYLPVVSNISGSNYIMFVGTTGLPPTSVSLIYQSSDCSERAFSSTLYTEGKFAKVAVILPPGRTLYVRDPEWVIAPVSFSSHKAAIGGACTQITYTSSEFAPVNPSVDLDTLFQAPLGLR